RVCSGGVVQLRRGERRAVNPIVCHRGNRLLHASRDGKGGGGEGPLERVPRSAARSNRVPRAIEPGRERPAARRKHGLPPLSLESRDVQLAEDSREPNPPGAVPAILVPTYG